MSVQRDELSALKFLDRLHGHLKHVREPQKALRYTLRETHEFFDASSRLHRETPARPAARRNSLQHPQGRTLESWTT